MPKKMDSVGMASYFNALELVGQRAGFDFVPGEGHAGSKRLCFSVR